jgi:hypothetical protein
MSWRTLCALRLISTITIINAGSLSRTAMKLSYRKAISRGRFRLPATLVAAGMIAGLGADTYRAWALSNGADYCRPSFAMLHIGSQQASTLAAEQAILAWEQQITTRYGATFASFAHAKHARSGASPCYPELDNDARMCGFAVGQPCRR